MSDTTGTTTDEGPPTLQIDGAVATIRLRRPSRRNSLTDEDLQALLAAIAAVDAEPQVRVLVLTADTRGQPKPVFSAGYDLGGLGADGAGPQLFERIPDALEAARPVTVCALNGSVFGGATDLVLACDLRLALAGSVWRMPACALGLHYYPSGLRRYVARFGIDLAKRAFLTAQPLPVEALAARGLFEAVVPGSDFDAAVQALVQQAAALAPLAAQATKRSLNEIAAGRDDEPALRERERLTQASADFAEGRAAFAQRRAPRFRGI
jgi:enoyl-CoA hydratase/carnithine racemase